MLGCEAWNLVTLEVEHGLDQKISQEVENKLTLGSQEFCQKCFVESMQDWRKQIQG